MYQQAEENHPRAGQDASAWFFLLLVGIGVLLASVPFVLLGGGSRRSLPA
ncbi:MAG: hypothetical protein ACAH27_03875 [Xanthobacteraceae bacterium]